MSAYREPDRVLGERRRCQEAPHFVFIATMQRGTAEIFLGLGLIVLGILALKLTDQNYWWASIALGAVVGSKGGISVSQRARV